MKSVQTCLAVCEEFTNTILVDKQNSSLIINVDDAWFDVLNTRLNKMGYKLIHKSKVGGGYTCGYIHFT